MRQVVARLVEEAMSKPRTNQDAEETVHEHRFELFFADFLLPIELVHEEIDTYEADAPAQRVPAYGEEAQVKGHYIRVPSYEQVHRIRD